MNPKRILLFASIIIFSFFMGAVLVKDSITKEAIKYAESIIGLEFTDAERDTMLGDLEDLQKDYETIRKLNIQNNIPPAILFNPIPVGKKFNFVPKTFKLSSYKNVKLPEGINQLAFYSIGELAELIRTKKITSEKLTTFYLERLKKYDPALHCVITLTADYALRKAKEADREIAAGKYKGVLHGIPFGVKDLLATKNFKTTWGSVPYKDQVINEDAVVVKRLEEAGGILCAKFTMGELAMDDVWFGGMTRNPWDTTQGSSGSSAGSASAVSAGLIPYAIGTETWGSIISPSTVCGTTGLRPTYGRVSRTGAMALSWSMDKIGAITRTAEDCAIVLNAIYGPDGIDQTLYDYPFNYSPEINLKNVKIGYLKSEFDKPYEFKKNDSLFLKTLKDAGAILIPIELPKLPINEISFILSTESAAAFDELTRSNKDDLMIRQTKNDWPNTFRARRFVPAVEYINANRIRFMLIQEMTKIFQKVDLYIAPSWEGDNLLLTNLTGHPAIVFPTGFSDKGLPQSISIIGDLFQEGKIISLAKKFQTLTDFHKKHPQLFL